MSLAVSEVFTSIQGEGPSAGEAAVFLRLANCNLNCAWCDTPYSWNWEKYEQVEEARYISLAEVAQQLVPALTAIRLLIVTGGEPLMQQAELICLFDLLRRQMADLRVEVETNGTIAPTPSFNEAVDLFVVSPKLRNSGVPEKRRVKKNVLEVFRKSRSVLKFVLVDPREVPEASVIALEAGFEPSRVWLMPEGTESDVVIAGMKRLAPECIAGGFNLSPRLHVILWNDARGT